MPRLTVRLACIAALASGVLIVCAVGMQQRFLRPKAECTFSDNRQDSAARKVVIIGDSWAGHNELVSGMRDAGAGEVLSYSHSGATSREVYRDMFGQTGCGGKADLLSGATSAVVIVGINDAAGHRGAGFYAYHLSLFVKALQARHVKPVIVLLPRFGVLDADHASPWYSTAKHELFHLIFDLGRDDTIAQYRAEVNRQAETKEALIFNPDSAIGSYSPNSPIWGNPAHLSPLGDRVLGRALGHAIQQSDSGRRL